jgi:hypothetical protein
MRAMIATPLLVSSDFFDIVEPHAGRDVPIADGD